jgi:O-antigen/teichoic acid export membrane protein
MLEKLKNIDAFTRNIVIVFAGSFLLNLSYFFCQLLLAHAISPADFAAFNTLTAIYMIVATPLTTLQTAVVKYGAEFNAQKQPEKIRSLFSFFLKGTLLLALLHFFIFYFSSSFIMARLKIPFASCGYILAFLIASSWVVPVFLGGIQGLELFFWLTLVTSLAGVIKLIFTFVFIKLGWAVPGALTASLISVLFEIVICAFILKGFLSFKKIKAGVDFGKILLYLFPVAISSACFISLVSMDMILVKLFFENQDAGFYSLAQMLGKIFLFLPAAIAAVLLPRASSLHAQNANTATTLKKSLLYAFILCGIAVAGYNFSPSLVLSILTGKALPESIYLGRLFSVSMTFFSLLFILTTYFLSIEDLRFIKYLLFFTFLQALLICLFHETLIQVQLVMCLNAILLLLIHLYLAIFKKPVPAKCRI